MKLFALVPICILLAQPAIAQDGAMGDMTIVGGAIAQGQIGEIEARKRAGGTARKASAEGSAARACANCARKAQFRARYGANDPKVRQFYRLCARAGY
ncbi:hypothetical protein [Sphingomonas sp.]|uniref:hypothetical protein n=1 Tax=Sphingomonas sp. TaxID=28214 RepID=UPI002ED960C9